MRLRKLLLGSAAAVMAAGAASVPAKAADMNGLVTTVANYLASCAAGNGIQFTAWCFHFYGQVEASTEFGQTWNWGRSVAAGGATVNLIDWGGFDLDGKLSLTATRETANGKIITVRMPIYNGDSLRLDIEKPGGYRLRFTSSSVELRLPTNFATFTFAIGDPDGPSLWPEVDVTAELTFGGWTVTAHGGVTWTDTDINGNATVEYDNWDADLTIAGNLGPVALALGGHYERVDIGGVIYPAWGVDAEATVEFGMFSLTMGVAHSINQSFKGHYNYAIVGTEPIWEAWGTLVANWSSMHRTTFGVIYAVAPGIGATSETLEFTLAHRWRPYGDSTMSINTEIWADRAWMGGPAWVYGAELGLVIPIN